MAQEKKEVQQRFKNAMVSEIELTNNTITKIATFFNASEIDHEELNIGITLCLKRCKNINRFKNSIYIISESGQKEIIKFPINENKH